MAPAFDAAALTPAERFEREYLLTVIDSDLFWLERARFPFRNTAWYIGQLDPDVYLAATMRRWRGALRDTSGTCARSPGWPPTSART